MDEEEYLSHHQDVRSHRDRVNGGVGHPYTYQVSRLPFDPHLLISVEEAATRLSIGRTRAYALVRQGELKSVKIGQSRRVLVTSLEEYIERLIRNDV